MFWLPGTPASAGVRPVRAGNRRPGPDSGYAPRCGVPAGVESRQVSATFDLTASFLHLAGVKAPAERLDGYDILRHAIERRADKPRQLFWRGRRGDRTWRAVRDGDMKLVQKTEGGRTERWLYDLSADIGEARDLLGERPAVGQRMEKWLAEWEAEVKAVR